VRSGVYAEGKTTDDVSPASARAEAKRSAFWMPLGRRVAAAHDRQGSRVQEIEAAADIEQRRWVRDLQQQLRILGVGQRDEMLAGSVGPGQRPFNGGPAVGGRAAVWSAGHRRPPQRAAASSEDRLWQPEGARVSLRCVLPPIPGISVSRSQAASDSPLAHR
jgi:hypothetical protein